MISSSGLITVIGGKWTTYRKMAEDTINNAILLGRLKASPCITNDLPIFGYDKNLIKPTTSAQKKQDAPRPTSTCLDSKKLEDVINYKFCTIESGISFIQKKSISK